MASQAIHDHPVPSALQDVFQSYLQSLEIFSTPVQPMIKSYARANLEFWELASRRSRAAMELPMRFGICFTPAQVLTECQSYMASAASDYSDAIQRASSAMVPLFQSTLPVEAAVADKPATVHPLYRDVIIVEPAAENAEAAARARRKERHDYRDQKVA